MEKMKRRNSQAQLSLHSSQEDVKNTTFKRDIFGMFPDEPILSGIDKCLYFFGITDFNYLINTDPCAGQPSVSEPEAVISSNDSRNFPGEAGTSSSKLNQSDHQSEGITPAGSKLHGGQKLQKSQPSTTGQSRCDEKTIPYIKPCLESVSSIQPRSSGSASYADVCPKSCLAMNFNLNSEECIPTIEDRASSKKSYQRSNCFKVCLKERNKECNTLKFSVKCRPKDKWKNESGKHDRDIKVTSSLDIPDVKPKIMDTKWALTRVNFFDDFSRTYEVMNMKPSQPKGVESEITSVFFAVLPDGTAVCYDCLEN